MDTETPNNVSATVEEPEKEEETIASLKAKIAECNFYLRGDIDGNYTPQSSSILPIDIEHMRRRQAELDLIQSTDPEVLEKRIQELTAGLIRRRNACAQQAREILAKPPPMKKSDVIARKRDLKAQLMRLKCEKAKRFFARAFPPKN